MFGPKPDDRSRSPCSPEAFTFKDAVRLALKQLALLAVVGLLIWIAHGLAHSTGHAHPAGPSRKTRESGPTGGGSAEPSTSRPMIPGPGLDTRSRP